jgi:Ran GTPase-activating protein (RanGAP) involved in mRNA processing and transport
MSQKPKDDERNVPGSSSSSFFLWVNEHITDETRLCMFEKQVNAEKAKRIAKELTPNAKLRELNFAWNNIGDKGVVALTGDFATNKTLTKLYLDHNQIGNAGMAALAQFLIGHDSLVKLRVCYNNFDNVGLMSLANALKINKGLRELWLRGNSVDDEGAGILADVLRFNTSLLELLLCHDSVGDVGASSLLSALTEVNTTLIHLHVGANASQEVLFAISIVTRANMKGTRLVHAGAEVDLSHKEIYIAEAGLIRTDLAGNTTTKALNLSRNNIGDQGSVEIAAALANNRTLKSIALSRNGIGDAGALSIATALLENNVLTSIFLDENRIGSVGAAAIAKTLRINACLQHLGLGQNSICNDGAVAIAGALRSNTTLANLDLRRNHITDDGAKALLEALKTYDCTMKSLNLEGNDRISPALRKAIDFVFASRGMLRSFLKYLGTPLNNSLIPLHIQALHRMSMNQKKRTETGAGPVFYLVRAAASTKEIKLAPPSRNRSRSP